jgi:hypothetical protein
MIPFQITKEEINELVEYGFRKGYIYLEPEDLMGFKNWRTRLNIWKMS